MNKNFNVILAELKAGRLNELLTEELADLIKAVSFHQKKGKLTLEMELHPRVDGEVSVICKVASKAPKRDTLESTAFISPDGNLLFNDPKQAGMFDKIRPVEMTETKIRKGE